jgi:glycosyltransferase involved in cell wall biosynthesis
MIRINQMIETLLRGDAIGDDAISIRKILRSLGYSSDIYVENIMPSMAREAKIVTEKAFMNSDIIIYHYGFIDELCKKIINSRAKKILIYHNVTPHTYFIGYDNKLAQLSKNIRDNLSMLTDKFDIVISDSEYNKQELINIGFKNVEVIPIRINFSKYDLEPDKIELDKDEDTARILFVGRIVPNKMIEDLINIFSYYYRNIDSNGKLVIVGDYSSSFGNQAYYKILLNLVDEYHIKNVYFTDKITLRKLVGYYKWANVFITMSAHEGFCVPLLESMYFGIPVIANNICAIPETLGGAGILINEVNYAEIAELIDICVRDKEIRKRIIERQYERLKDFDYNKVRERFKSCIDKLIEK